MKKFMICMLTIIFCIVCSTSAVFAQKPKPFGFEIGKTSYQDALKIVQDRGWSYEEYEKKQFKRIDPKSPAAGKNTFLAVKTKSLQGSKGIRLFFSGKSVVDALIVILEPNLFEIVMDDLDRKYDLVEKNLQGENFTEDYTRVLWQKNNLYIELQKLSAHHVRLIYVEKVLFENYKDFLFKPYESFRRRQHRPDWMKDL